MRLERRGVLGLGLVGLGAVAGGAPVMAAAPPAGARVPGFYRFMVGDIEVTLVHDGAATRPLAEGFVKNAELSSVQGALAAAFQPTDTLTVPFTATVLNTGGRLVMIDAGNGDMGSAGTGRWMEHLRASGYAPEQVDTIVVSHFHGDHIQGIRAKDGSARFANATVMVPEAEWAFWMDDGQMSRAPEAMRPAFQNVRRVFGPIAEQVERYGDGIEVAPGITALAAPGHTPGHHAFTVASGDQRLLVWSDTTNKPELFVRNPGWHATFDMDPIMAEATRRRMLDMAAAERMPVAGYHFPFPALGHMARDEGGYRYVPTFWRA